MSLHLPSRAAVAAVVAALALASALPGQTPPASAAGGAAFESYHFSDAGKAGMSSLSLLTLPFGARVPLGGAASLEIGSAFAQANLKRSDGTSAALSGLTDTQVGLSLAVREVTLSAFGLLPTGASKLSDEQAEVAGKIAADLLPFRISNWGTGGGFGLGTTVAHRFAATTVGGSAGYVFSREYDAVEGFAYRPGNELRLRVGLETRVSPSGSLGFQLTFQKSAIDQANGRDLYRAGTRVQALGSYSFASGTRSSGVIYGGLLHRPAGTYLSAAAVAASQDLLLAGGRLRLPLGRGVLEPLVDTRFFRSADGMGQGWVAGAGATLQWPASPTFVVMPTVRGRLGSLDVRAGQTSGFSGIDAGLTLRFGRVR